MNDVKNLLDAIPWPALLVNKEMIVETYNSSAKNIEVDTEKHQVTYFSKKILLGPKEYQLLVALIEKPERVLTREFLLDRIWPDNLDIETRTVDVHLARLRKSLKLAGKSDPIRTVRGVGYSIQLI